MKRLSRKERGLEGLARLVRDNTRIVGWEASKPVVEAFVKGRKAVRGAEKLKPLVRTGRKTRAGMTKGRLSRWGDPEKRYTLVQRFLNKHRKDFPQLGNNVMILHAAEQCGRSESTIRRYIREHFVTIPPKATR
jgi:hypothetical protein